MINKENMDVNIILRKNDNQLMAFVQITPNGLRGVDKERKCKKQIVLFPEGFDTSDVVEGVLYKASLKQMFSGKGFVIQSLSPVQYYPTININHVPKAVYELTVSWKRTKFIFNPFDGNRVSVKNKDAFCECLSNRLDLFEKELVTKYISKLANKLVRDMQAECPWRS